MATPPGQKIQIRGGGDSGEDPGYAPSTDARRHAHWSIHLAAASMTLATFGVRWILASKLQDVPILILFVVPIAISAHIGGFGPGMLSTILSALLAAPILMPPNPYGIGVSGVAVMCVTLLIVGSIISLFTEALHSSRRRAQESHNLLAIALTSIGDAIITTDVQGRITFFNREAEHLTGVAVVQVVGRPLSEAVRLIDERTRKPLEDLVDDVLEADEVMTLPGQVLLLSQDGREIPIDNSAAPIRDGDAPPRGIALVLRDRSLRTQAETARREHMVLQQKLTKIAATAPGVIHEFLRRPDGSTCFPYASPKIEEIYGLTAEQLAADASLTHPLTHPDDVKLIRESVAESLRTMQPWRMQFRIMHPRKGQIWVEGHSTPERDPDGSCRWYGFLTDITDRKAAELGLIQAQERLQAALRAGGLGTWEWDLSDGRATWDGNVDTLLGEEFHGTPDDAVQFFVAHVHPDDRQSLEVAMQKSIAGADFNAEYRVVRPDGSIRWLAGRGLIHRDPQSARLRMVGACVDITGHKQLEFELARAKEAAEASNRAKDYFLAMVSHELRTPLTPVLLLASSLERNAGVPAAFREEISIIRANAEAEARLIDDLLDLTRIAFGKFSLEMGVADLHAQVRRAAEICREELDSRRQTLVIDLQAASAHVTGDAQRLLQVFWNLLQNASKYTSDGGSVTIRTRNQRQREAAVQSGASAVGVNALPAPGDDRELLVIEVQDTGMGITPDALPRIFEPFEQPHRALQNGVGGIGLGLTISKAIIEAHHGALLVTSGGADQGTTFTVQLLTEAVVQSAAPVEPAPPAPKAAAAARKAAKILLVEDHLVTARNLQKLIQSEGYEVRAARDIASAISLLDGEKFDILLTDLGLPDGDGARLIEHIRAAGLTTRGIVLSGYGMEVDLHRTRDAGFDAHLVKPVTAEQLLDALREVCDKIGSA